MSGANVGTCASSMEVCVCARLVHCLLCYMGAKLVVDDGTIVCLSRSL